MGGNGPISREPGIQSCQESQMKGRNRKAVHLVKRSQAVRRIVTGSLQGNHWSMHGQTDFL